MKETLKFCSNIEKPMRFLTIYRIQPNSEKLGYRETHFGPSQLGESPRHINEWKFILVFCKKSKN